MAVKDKRINNSPPLIYNKKYHPLLARLFFGQGGIDIDFCSYVEISEKTFYNWKKKYKEFRTAIEQGKLDPDSKVESCLFKNATENENVTAQIFWLKNRMRDRWRDKVDIESTETVTIQIVDDIE